MWENVKHSYVEYDTKKRVMITGNIDKSIRLYNEDFYNLLLRWFNFRRNKIKIQYQKKANLRSFDVKNIIQLLEFIERNPASNRIILLFLIKFKNNLINVTPFA